MPTLDDAPTIEAMTAVTLAGSTDDTADVVTQVHELDLIQVFDVSEQKAKVITVRNLATALQIAV